MKKYIALNMILLFFIGISAQAGPAWGPPGWPNGAPDTGSPPRTCYKTVRYCTEWLKDGHCKLWDTKQEEVACPQRR